jgi:hypothetical protein
VFLSWPWIENFVRQIVGEADELELVSVVDSAQRPRVLLPLWRDAARACPLLRCLRALGNYYSSYFAPICAPEDPDLEGVLKEAVATVCQDPRRWHIIDLLPMDPESTPFAHLRDGFRSNGMHVAPYFVFGNWYYPVEGRRFADFVQGSPSRLRNTFERKRRKLKRAHDMGFVVYTRGEALERGIREFAGVYHASWKPPEPFPEFLPALIRAFANEGWSRLGILYVDGKPAAAQYWIVAHGTASIYKLAYNPAYTQFSVGTVLSMLMFEYAIEEDRVATIDFLTGDDDFKQLWMSHRRERWGLQVANTSTLWGRGVALRNRVGTVLRERLERFRPRRHD